MKQTYESTLTRPGPPMRTYCGFNLEVRKTRRLFVGLMVACYLLIAASLWSACRCDLCRVIASDARL
jgi:hypothetical protein